jgi:hypothetical protein
MIYYSSLGVKTLVLFKPPKIPKIHHYLGTLLNKIQQTQRNYSQYLPIKTEPMFYSRNNG